MKKGSVHPAHPAERERERESICSEIVKIIPPLFSAIPRYNRKHTSHKNNQKGKSKIQGNRNSKIHKTPLMMLRERENRQEGSTRNSNQFAQENYDVYTHIFVNIIQIAKEFLPLSK